MRKKLLTQTYLKHLEVTDHATYKKNEYTSLNNKEKEPF